MSGPTMQAVQEMAEISHLPASMNGSPILFVTTLTAMMCGTVLGAYVIGWMGRDLVRDRKHVGFKSVLFNFRLMMALCGLAAFLACLPEVLYLQMYGDPQVSEATQAAVMTGKRLVDTSRVYIIIGWVGLLTMIYPYICLSLMSAVKDGEDHIIEYLKVEDYPGLSRLWKPASIFIILGLIAMAFALAKVYGA